MKKLEIDEDGIDSITSSESDDNHVKVPARNARSQHNPILGSHQPDGSRRLHELPLKAEEIEEEKGISVS